MAAPSPSSPKPDLDRIRAAIRNPPVPPKVSPLLILETSTWRGIPAPVVLWILAGLLARREAGCLAGRSNVGKGFLVLLFMISVATGRDMFGRKGTGKPMKAVLIEMEDSPEELHRRIIRGIELMRMDPSWTSADEDLFWENLVIITPNWHSTEAKTLKAIMPAIDNLLTDLTKDGGEIGLLVLDTFAALSGGDENSVEAQRDMLACLYQLRDLTGACILAVHHLRKPANGGKGPGISDRLNFDFVRGSSAIVASFRFLLQVEPLTATEAGRIGLDEDLALRGHYAILATTKVVSGPKGDWILMVQQEGGFWAPHPQSDHLCASLQSKKAVDDLTLDEGLLRSIADGCIDRKELGRRHWSSEPEKHQAKLLKGAMNRLRGRHGWIQRGNSFALTVGGFAKINSLKSAGDQGGNQPDPDDDQDDPFADV